ncbi:MAG: amidase [Pyrinomonadaceae bacterium]|nr:amidase [Pyrinomonadaceae bacterium]
MNGKTRREFLQISASLSAGLLLSQKMNAQTSTNTAQTFEFDETTIAELQAKMTSGELSAVSITEKYLQRIEQVDRNGAKVNSIIELNPDALEIARKMDAERKSGKIRSQLHGVPVLIKDNIDTADKMLTTAGSLALTDNYAKQDAFIVSQLRNAGAVILGKTNLSEWANFRSSKSTSGWSGRGGQTHNPYILDRNPCGSSSGTGAAIAANLAVVGIGTETDGSVVCPASTCGLVGIKPTLGMVSRSGIIPIAHSQDTAGPMTRTVSDAAVLLGLMAGVDAKDSITIANRKNGTRNDYTQFLRKDGLRGARLGVARQFFGKNAKVDKVIENSLLALKDNGAILVDVTFPTLDKFGDAEFEVLLYEFKTDLEKYLQGATTKYKTLQSLIEFNDANASKEMPYFGQELFLRSQKKGNLMEREYRLALQQSKMMTQAQGIDAVVNQNKLDAIVAPSGGTAWATDLINGDCGVYESSSLAAVAGYPNITVPAGFVQNLPVGISFFGKAFTEATLIKIAYAFEQATKARKSPQFLLSV